MYIAAQTSSSKYNILEVYVRDQRALLGPVAGKIFFLGLSGEQPLGHSGLGSVCRAVLFTRFPYRS